MTDEEPRRWLYGLTADEWLHLACEGEKSEVAPCCGNISQLREWLQSLTTCQDGYDDYLMRYVRNAYEIALEGHETLADPSVFPLLHRVLAGMNESQSKGHHADIG